MKSAGACVLPIVIYAILLLTHVCVSESQFVYPTSPCYNLQEDKCIQNCVCGWCDHNTTDSKCMSNTDQQKCEQDDGTFTSDYHKDRCKSTRHALTGFAITMMVLFIILLFIAIVACVVILSGGIFECYKHHCRDHFRSYDNSFDPL